MSSEGFRGVPGAPEGWELVHASRQAESAEHYLNNGGHISCATCRTSACYPIIRKIEQPAKYRAFENAEEFNPHRGRWWRYNDSQDSEHIHPPCAYSAIGPAGSTWKQAFKGRVFEDGTTFGVKVEE